jgi:hypothetical protein
MERTYPVTLTDAADDIIRSADGAAPPVAEVKVCAECGTRGEIFMQVTEVSDAEYALRVCAPCKHVLDALHVREGEPAYVVWGGRRGYSVLPPSVAWYV